MDITADPADRHSATTDAPPEAARTEELFAELYAHLHRLARRELARRGGGGLGATTLLHEAYLQLAGQDGRRFPDHARFMAYASRVMRGLVIDHVRRGRAVKRGGEFHLTAIDTTIAAPVSDPAWLERISQALDALATTDPPLAQVVDLKFFCGFTFIEIAALHGVSERTVQRQWEKARMYLHQALGPDALA